LGRCAVEVTKTSDLAITRIANSCALVEFGGEAVLTDPWFTEYWHMHRGEPLGMTVAELPSLKAIIASHYFINHWDMRAMKQYKFRDETKVFTCTDKMARQAGEAGFLSAEHVSWGEQRSISDQLTLEVVPAHASGRARLNNYVVTSPALRLFFGGEARDLEPLRKYASEHPPVDIVMAPVNGVRVRGGPVLVMGPDELLEAARILGAHTVVPVHDAKGRDPVWSYIQRQGTMEDARRKAAALPEPPSVVCLSPGERWQFWAA
jgi:L-ascorbate metabolism protein UlaG (beta-lactamase superfamily)